MRDSRFLGTSLGLFELIKYAAIIIVVAIMVIVFLGVPLPVSGQSMEPNFKSGQIVVVSQLGYSSNEAVRRGDVVAARFPADPKKTRLIKRVVGLPGETVHSDQGKIYISGQLLAESYTPREGLPPYEEMAAVTLKQGEYFLVGDNRPGSSDSRLWGPVQRSDIQGRVSFVIWPLGSMSYVDRISY